MIFNNIAKQRRHWEGVYQYCRDEAEKAADKLSELQNICVHEHTETSKVTRGEVHVGNITRCIDCNKELGNTIIYTRY